MTSKKIAIIGAGPAGITLALELKDIGFQDVTVFGDFGEAQCRTVEVDGVVADVGTCYVHSGYWNTVKPLVKRYGFHLNYLPNATLANDDLHKPAVPPAQKIRTLLNLFRFLALSFRYLTVYRTERSRDYGLTMQEYLDARGLGAFSRSFIFGPGGIAQGYGFFGDITAYGGLRWFRPSIFFTPVANKMRRGTATIRQGYGKLFQRVLADLSHRPEKISAVNPVAHPVSGAAQVELVSVSGERYVFDHAVIACRLDGIASPVSALFTPGTICTTRFFSLLWTSASPPWFADRVYLTDAIQREDRNKILTYRFYGATQLGEYLYWGAGYAGDDISDADLKEMLCAQVEGDLRCDIRSVRFFDCFQYNVRFSAPAIREGLHLKVNELQGAQNIWYSGGLLSHWDVDSIMEHNRLLAARMAYRGAEGAIGNKAAYYWRTFRARLAEI